MINTIQIHLFAGICLRRIRSMRVNTLDGAGVFLKLSVVVEFCCSFGVVMIGIVVVGGRLCLPNE